MKKEEFKKYFNQEFQGIEDFIDNIVTPIGSPTGKIGTRLTHNYATDYVTECAAAHVQAVYDYGEYNVDNTPVSVWEVVLTDNCQIGRARKQIQRVVRILTNNYTGAFIVFHYDKNSTNPDAKTWRLSWVKKEDTQANSTTAKRYTYLCGPAYSCRTIAERFEVLQDTERKTLDSITKAFDVEALSEEFFYNFRALYSKIQGDGEKDKSKYKRYKKLSDIPENELGFCDFIVKHRADSDFFGSEFARWNEKVLRDYVKKLMGRLVFLQFLQKKGWMCGNPNYIKDLFENFVRNNGQKETDICAGSFLDKVLEPLFFGVLNTKVDDRKQLFSNNKWNLNLLNEWKDIPYLNGGLFEQEEYDKPKSAFPNILFNELFTLFSEYNFTIDENDPNDAEVGIDPEMLSKIFESQLEDNKDKGAFYTPKYIVDYMCKESLIAYLQTGICNDAQNSAIRAFIENNDEDVPENLPEISSKLEEVKICDPAIGSGAFPMGMLNLLVSARERLGETKSRLELKTEIIQNNIYGVDIEKGAVDIARLRFWLSLIIDEEEAQALPNLDYKIMQGDSLIHRFKLNASFKNILADYNKANKKNYTIDDYKQWVKVYLYTSDHKQKENFRKMIDNIKSAFKTELTKKECAKVTTKRGEIYEIETRGNMFPPLTKAEKDKIKKLNAELKKLEQEQQDILSNKIYQNSFEWRFEFPQLLDDNGDFVGFDIVIGNPPYVVVSKENPYKQYNTYQSFDLYAYFYELGLNITRLNGTLTFITPDLFVKTMKFASLRSFLEQTANLRELKITGDKVFDAEVPTCIVRFEKSVTKNWHFSDMVVGNTILSKIEKQLMLKDIANIQRGLEIGRNKVLPCGDYEILTGSTVQKYVPTTVKYISRSTYVEFAKDEYYYTGGRLLLRETGSSLTILYVENKIYCNRSLYTIKIKDDEFYPKYILGYLNSRLIQFYYSQKFKCDTEIFPKIRIAQAKLIPIFLASKSQQQPIITLVNRILAAKQQNPQADTSKEEAIIDILVYLLYNLTYDEVKVVDNAFAVPENVYNLWLSNYQTASALPTEAEMCKAMK